LEKNWRNYSSETGYITNVILPAGLSFTRSIEIL